MATTASSSGPSRDRVLDLVRRLPDECTFDQILDLLFFVRRIEEGLEDSDAGRSVSHEEAGRIIRSWEKERERVAEKIAASRRAFEEGRCQDHDEVRERFLGNDRPLRESDR